MPAASADAYEVLTNRIQKEFVALLSPEDLKAIIDREIHDLSAKYPLHGQPKSVLERAVESVLYSVLRERVEIVLETEGTREKVTTLITKFLHAKLGEV